MCSVIRHSLRMPFGEKEIDVQAALFQFADIPQYQELFLGPPNRPPVLDPAHVSLDGRQFLRLVLKSPKKTLRLGVLAISLGYANIIQIFSKTHEKTASIAQLSQGRKPVEIKTGLF